MTYFLPLITEYLGLRMSKEAGEGTVCEEAGEGVGASEEAGDWDGEGGEEFVDLAQGGGV